MSRGDAMNTSLISRNVTVNGHRTSLRLEQVTWDALDDICVAEGLGVHEICSMIDSQRIGSSRTSAVRTFILSYFRNAAMDAGILTKSHMKKAKRRNKRELLKASA
jgi:predicted DNA-binding ribbon-helix-helix protein